MNEKKIGSICEDINNKILNICDEKLNNSDEIYIWGAKKLGEKILYALKTNNYKIDGFIDNNIELQNTLIDNVKIYTPNNIKNKNALIIVASLFYGLEIQDELLSKGFNNILHYHYLALNEKFKLNPAQALVGLQNDYYKNEDEYKKLFNLFDDEKSKKVLTKLIEFRKTYNIEAFRDLCEPLEKQYVEDFMPKDCPVFVDGGGFIGDSTPFFAKLNPNYKKIYFFEPDENLISQAKNNLKNLNNVIFHKAGISDSNKILRFKASDDNDGCFTNSGDIEIECVSLDNTITEDVAYIKMDIEGSEIEALNGAKRLIKNGSPLAICVYHKAEDLRLIPNLILKINPNYKFILRHYTNTIFDTVLYAFIGKRK